MLDTQGKEVLPSEFLAGRGAQRSDEEHRPLGGRRVAVVRREEASRICLFVRLSRDSARDRDLPRVAGQCTCASSRAEPQRLCLQITEESRHQPHARRSRRWPRRCAQRRFRFALEGFGSGRDSRGLIESLPLDFVKIDGSLMQGLAGRPAAAAARARAGGGGRASAASRPSPSASRMPTPWRCCGSSACSTSRATSSTRPKRWCSAQPLT